MTTRTRIRREDSIFLEANQDEVFRVLLDLHAYKDWWPRSIRFRFDEPGPVKVGTQVGISNQGSVRWVAEVTAIEPNRRITFHYRQGAWEGTAGWTLKPAAGGVLVSYVTDIVPAPFWLRVLGRFVDLGAMHSRQMQGILQRLKARLGPRVDLKSRPEANA